MGNVPIDPQKPAIDNYGISPLAPAMAYIEFQEKLLKEIARSFGLPTHFRNLPPQGSYDESRTRDIEHQPPADQDVVDSDFGVSAEQGDS
jgi:phage portal protein BeeE